MKRRRIFVLLLIPAICFNLYYILRDHLNFHHEYHEFVVSPILGTPTPTSTRGSKLKLVLLWTPSWSSRQHPVKGWDIDDDTLRDCSFKCDFTSDKSLLEISDALVYHGVDWHFSIFRGLFPLPIRRNFDQIWTFLRIESPAMLAHRFSAFDNMFNWTATYRLDSDVPLQYGRFEPIKTSLKKSMTVSIPTEESIRNKSLVGWMVSNCNTQSRRDILVTKLKKYIPIDIYGYCSPSGGLKCLGDCYATLSKKYKFWLSFENSLCPDYLTEKFYKTLVYGMVPVLYAHHSVTHFLPKGSYIDVNDFPSVKELANYLLHLDKNPADYLKYFEWKKLFRVSSASRLQQEQFWCSFCTKLHSVSNLTRKTYESIDNWFYYNNTDTFQCVDPRYPGTYSYF